MFIRCRSLNPYYTGIHLHYGEKQEDYEVVVVLILIILEYIYIETGCVDIAREYAS